MTKIKNMQLKLIIPKDAVSCSYGGYECEWCYNKEKNKFLLAFQRYSSMEYQFILFEGVVGYKFSNWMFDELRIPLIKHKEDGFLYEVISNKNKNFKQYMTLQPPRGSLQIFASSYKIMQNVLRWHDR